MEDNQESTEWLSPIAALSILESRFDSVAAKALIADKLRDGLICAKAETMWLSSDRALSPVPKGNETDGVQLNTLIKATIWRSSRHWASDKELWRWQKSRFVVTRKKKPFDRTIMTNVQFLSEDIQKLLLKPQDKLVNHKKKGRPFHYEGWAKFGCALVLLERQNKLTAEYCENYTKFSNLLADIIDENLQDKSEKYKKPLDPESMRKAVEFVWDRFLSAPPN